MARFVLALTACSVLLMASTFVAPRAPSTAPRVVQPQRAPEVNAEQQQQQQPVLAVLLGLVLGALAVGRCQILPEVDSK